MVITPRSEDPDCIQFGTKLILLIIIGSYTVGLVPEPCDIQILERLFISYHISRYSTFGLADQRNFMTTKEPTYQAAGQMGRVAFAFNFDLSTGLTDAPSRPDYMESFSSK
jgi:hypothetical protein